ncbi:unnamed protein product, partial [Coregonus sp. 'balchen']
TSGIDFKGTATATEITVQVLANCNVSTGNTSVFSNSSTAILPGLSPGSIHSVYVLCNDYPKFNSCRDFITKGNSSFYRVEWTDGSKTINTTTHETAFNINELTAGVWYTFRVTAVAEDNMTEGVAYVTNQATKPAVIAPPTVIQTTTSLSLSWTKPTGEAAGYRVEWQNGGTVMRQLTSTTSAIIEGLTPGTQYTLQVFAIAQDNSTAGDPRTVYVYTKPVQPVNIVTMGRGTSELNVTWTLPGGSVDQYNVNISNAALSYTSSQTTQTTMASFTGLQSGMLYEVTVTAVAGPFSNQSARGQLATVPNPPGPLNITERTTSSLSSTSNLSRNLCSLSSGTFYTITVITVGPQDLGSAPVNTSGYTLPKPVVNLTASPLSTSSVKLQWTDPVDVKSYYSYRVQYSNTTGPVEEETVNTNFTDVPGLEPGTGYNFTVTTVAAAGSDGIPENTFSYTKPKAVSNLMIEDLNTTAIRLSWSKQDDHKPTYSYLVTVSKSGSMVENVSTTVESYTFTHLQPGDSYTFSVVTVVQGIKSDSVGTSSYTRTTTTMNVTWDAPVGQVDSYTVTIYNDNVMENNLTISNDSLEVVFQNLKPGKVYVVRVVTNSGPLTDASLNVTNATYPNPPGTQTVEDQTTGSINISWARPLDMDLGQYWFSVFHLDQQNLTEHNWILLENLQSGTLYNIAVVTVGPLDYQSTVVTTTSYTRPDSVSGLTEAGITPTDVTLVWDQPENKADYSFKVEVTYPNGSLFISVTVNNTTTTVTGLQSGSNYTFTVTTLTEDGTMATPVKVFYYTRPYPISGLVAPTVNTTAVHLTWTKPPQYQSGYTYRIQTEGCVSTPTNHTVTGEVAVITELTPGTNCTFSVSVKAQDGIEGGTVSIFQYTEPESVQPSISNNGTTSTMVVSWAAPPGNVGQYVVHLNSTDQVFTPVWLNSNQQTHTFMYLLAGRQYTAVVTTISGPFDETSGPVTTATQPNPPGPIVILEKTTSSITVEWGEAPLMANTTFSYLVKYLSTQTDEKTVNTTNTTEEHVTLTWSKPVGHKPGYSYRVTWTNSTGFIISNTTTAMESLLINGLVPGSLYNFAVTIQTDDGTEGAPVSTSSCTNASPVSNLKCYSPNDPDAKLTLSWTKPKGLNQGFQITAYETIQLPQGQVHNETSGDCNPACGHTVPGLKHNTDYTLTVTTLGCGETSTVQSLTCKTGITGIQTKKDSSDIQIHSMSSTVAVRVEDYEAYYKKQRADSNCGFAEEFEDLKLVGTAQAKTSALAMENKSKNRYNNVLPYDSSRVKLSIHGSPFDDYINSNYIPGYNSRKEFIAAQGPLPGTVNEFWRMIWEKNVQTLVKCEEYYSSETKHFEYITVKTAETRSVRHFHFTAWPDHGVPETTELLINFRHLVREHMDQYSRHSPTVVHCREGMVDVYGTIHELRMHRPLMVQTEEQYVFLNQCAMDIIRSRTGTNVDLIYQNTAALTIYENVEPRKDTFKNGYHNA